LWREKKKEHLCGGRRRKNKNGAERGATSMKDRSGYLSIIQGLTANSVCVQSLSASGNEGNSFGQAHAGSNVGGEDERFWLFCRFNASSHPLSTHADEFIFIII
jgi:hypothetical protein